MRLVPRPPLDSKVQADLATRQVSADAERAAGTLDVTAVWKAARQSDTLRRVLATLQQMVGARQRCMYCVDSHGTDIEHFWPKTPFPERMFVWPNLLLCCAECGRFKQDFPLSDGKPLLIDPTSEDPWLQLDFDPSTGNIVPRFDPAIDDYSVKGSTTVGILHLDRREAMAAGYQKTYRRLCALVEAALNQARPTADNLIRELQETDDHGLLEWCLAGSGQEEYPFQALRDKFPAVWRRCEESLGHPALPDEGGAE